MPNNTRSMSKTHKKFYVKKEFFIMNNEIITNNNAANIYLKIQMCRVELQAMNLRKTGKNKFAGFSYYTLEDITPTLNNLLLKYRLASEISFNNQIGRLKLVNIDNTQETLIFEAPMREAEQKGCNSVQNLGATITYMRRYLYLIAFDIVEYDTFDAITGRPGLDNRTNNIHQDIDYIERNLTQEQKSKIYIKYKVNNLGELPADVITACVKKIKQ